ncbi:hypothetical protein BJD55_gp115 [Gordonia phage Yvonnetastic]|uniref:Uncharacterized protein n=1 Tax=Gordonia phage Yvonnetastic TaxID=1821566 RepID=A0A142K968_9CAUD|nr:hypothetical protein BJD55_gp115 [Gordonia phage Yvonnetastic]AMS02651.1 hypothetical protein SEA_YVONNETASTIC_107 [Gordonia phage Yvonnetastic]
MATFLRWPSNVPYLWNDGPRQGIPFEWLVGFETISELSVGQVIECRERLAKVKGTITISLVDYTGGVFSGDVRWEFKT